MNNEIYEKYLAAKAKHDLKLATKGYIAYDCHESNVGFDENVTVNNYIEGPKLVKLISQSSILGNKETGNMINMNNSLIPHANLLVKKGYGVKTGVVNSDAFVLAYYFYDSEKDEIIKVYNVELFKNSFFYKDEKYFYVCGAFEANCKTIINNRVHVNRVDGETIKTIYTIILENYRKEKLDEIFNSDEIQTLMRNYGIGYRVNKFFNEEERNFDSMSDHITIDAIINENCNKTKTLQKFYKFIKLLPDLN